jgi:hypothetical protein
VEFHRILQQLLRRQIYKDTCESASFGSGSKVEELDKRIIKRVSIVSPSGSDIVECV